MNIQHFCRACFSSSSKMVPLFDGDGLEIEFKANYFIVDLLQMFTNEVVIQNDTTFSNYICVKCFDEMQRTNEFMFKCKTSAQTFRQLANSQVQLERLEHLTKQFDAYEKYKSLENKIIVVDDVPYPTISLKEEIIDDYQFETEQITDTPVEHVDIDIVYDMCIDEAAHSSASVNETDATEPDSEQPSCRVIQCPACLDTFTTISTLRSHLIGIHTMENKCIMCDNEYFGDIWNHTKQHLPRNELCWKCGKKFVRLSNLQKHIKSHMHEVSVCKYCSVEFTTKDLLKLHVAEIHRFDCDICYKKFDSKSIVNRHKITHLSDKGPYKCDICGKVLSGKFCFDRHIERCIEPFNCKQCSFIASSRYQLILHEKNHIIPHLIYTCKRCPQQFLSQPDLIQHSIEHVVDKFASKPDSNEPKRNSATDTNYTCTHCSKTFTEISVLEKHMINHFENQKNEENIQSRVIRKHKCPICYKAFRLKASLTHHSIISHRDKTLFYTCGLCKFITNETNFLHKHLSLKHSGAKNIPCGLCDIVHEDITKLFNHWRTHHQL